MPASTVSAESKVAIKTLGILAGEGKLPALLAQSAREQGFRVVAFALSPEAGELVQAHAHKLYVIAPGQLGRNMKLVKEEGVEAAVFIGKVPKLNLLRQIHKLDWMAIKELSKLPNFNDDTIQFAMGDIMEAHGVKVLTQTEFLKHLFPGVGVLTKRQPTASEYADVDFGLKMAKEIARLDIGQTVVVKDRMILAIEAIEGTDQAIRRGVQLANGPVVVVKVAKPDQDKRFDIPTVGMNTLNSMTASKSSGVLAIEANETMVVEQDEMVAYADAHNICMVAV